MKYLKLLEAIHNTQIDSYNYNTIFNNIKELNIKYNIFEYGDEIFEDFTKKEIFKILELCPDFFTFNIHEDSRELIELSRSFSNSKTTVNLYILITKEKDDYYYLSLDGNIFRYKDKTIQTFSIKCDQFSELIKKLKEVFLVLMKNIKPNE